MRRTGIISMFLLFCCLESAGQYANLKFENLSTAEGLSSSTCVDIFQDSDGFLWFGTIDGLNKYNGYEFEVYRSVINDPHSISSNRISAITEDREGRLWVGTSSGLNVFDKNSGKFYRINNRRDDPQSIVSDLVNDLFYDRRTHTLWVATRDGVCKLMLDGVALPLRQELKFVRYVHTPGDAASLDNNDATGIFSDKENNVWVVTSGQYLNRYDPGRDKFERSRIDVDGRYALDHLPKAVLVDHEGDFWIGNDLSGLIVWDRKRNIFTRRSFAGRSVPIFHIYQDRRNIIWIATDGYGIYFADKEQGITEHITHNPSVPFSLSNNQPSHVLEDRNGIIWIATYNTGVNKLALSKSAFGHFFHQPGNRNSLSTPIAQSVIQDRQERIWIGTDGGGLNLFDERTNTFTHFRHIPGDPRSLSSDKVLYLCESYDGSIWVCTWDGGLNKFNPATKKAIRYKHDAADPFSIGQNTVWYAVEDSLHRLWLGTTTAGLNLFDPATGKFHQYLSDPADPAGLTSNFVFSLFIDSRQRLLVGTATGLCAVDLRTLKTRAPEKLPFRSVRAKSLQGNRINYITEDAEANLWLGTDLGLHKLSTDLTLLASYTTQEGLPNNQILGVKEDDGGNLWITTKTGLSRLDPRTHKFKNFNTHDGIQGMEFQSKSVDKTRDGRILVGGINGFNIFEPEKILSDTARPRLLFTDFRIFNRSVRANDTVNRRVVLQEAISKTDAIILRYDENYVSFDFLALNYSNPEKSRYAYRMLGLDDDWNYAGNKRSASYSNLAPGGYTFEVKVSDDGSWNDSGISVALSILPPPWKTWWAYSLYAVALALAVWMSLRYYARRVREEKEHELDQMKLSFFINVSHEFRTPLTLILNPIDKILSAYTNADEVRSSAMTIQRSAHRLLNLVNQLLDFRKTDLGKAPLETVQGDIVQFNRDIFQQFNDLAGMKQIDFRFESAADSLPAWFDPDKVEKIVTNLLSNAIKFTGQGGCVVLSVDRVLLAQKNGVLKMLKTGRDKEYVEIKVKDTGVGLKKEQLRHVFERFFHVDNSKTGTGIGLHFTKSLVELHHGQIAVESEYGRGSTFAVRLPLNEKRTRQKQHSERAAVFRQQGYTFDSNTIKAMEYELAIADAGRQEDSTTEVAGNGTERRPVLLIVEDNRELRVHLKNELRNSFRIKEAVNGADGLEKVLKFYPDIIISDIMMPEMDGFELCRKIKTGIETSHIPVVLLTARSLEEDKIEGYQTGADEYLPKPFNIHVLKARLKNLLEARQRLKEKFASSGVVLPAKEVTTNTLDEVFLDKVTRAILEQVSDPDFTLDQLLVKVGISRSHFFRKINSLTGQNPSQFIRTVRLKYAAELLLKRHHSIKEVSYMAGFNSSAYFSKTFRELFGKTPQQYAEESQ